MRPKVEVAISLRSLLRPNQQRTLPLEANLSTGQKWKRPLLFFALFIAIIGITISNFFLVGGGDYSPQQVAHVLGNPTFIANENNILQYDPVKHFGLEIQEYRDISYGVWSTVSTLVACAGLAITGLATQALVRNPLADASTLGFMQGGVFALVSALGLGWTEYYLKFIAAILGIVLAAGLIFGVIFLSKSRMASTKIILAGLAIGIIFRTFTFLVRYQDKYLSSTAFTYTLGGTEAVNLVVGPNQWETLYISSGLIAAAVIIFALISRSLSILDIGDEKAKQLGVKVRTVKSVTVFLLILTTPAAIILVGNLAFVGLFAAHLARYFLKSRNYSLVLLPAIFIGAFLGSTGLFLFNFVPNINSGIFMVIIGAPYLIWAGIRGLR